MALHFIAKTNNLQCTYKDYDLFVQLGFTFYSGSNIYKETIPLTDDNFFSLLETPIYKNISIRNNVWCQTKEFSFYIEKYINEPTQKQLIIHANPFSKRYGNNTWVVITGASSGQGRDMALAFAKRNFNILMIGSKRTDETAKEIQSLHSHIKTKINAILVSR